MRIVVGSLQQESNTLTSRKSTYSDFTIHRGNDMLCDISVTEYFSSEDVTLIPTLYANAVPGGALRKSDFQQLARELVSGIPSDNIDGIWLYLHGALEVENVGSGELALLQMVRRKVGNSIPISLALDFHANNTRELMYLVNMVAGYRTVPHRDMAETEVRAAKLLIYCIRNKLLPRPQMARVPVVVPGDSVLTDELPLRTIMEEAAYLEQQDGMLVCNVFNGQPWVDAPNMGPSIICVHTSEEKLAAEAAVRLATLFFDLRKDFKFSIEACEPEEALNQAYGEENRPVFVTDSGDNTTAGSAGDNAFLLRMLQEKGMKGVLLAGITDRPAVEICHSAEIGCILDIEVGGTIEPESVRTRIKGELIYKGDIEGWYGENAGPCAILRCDGNDVILTANRCALIKRSIFTRLGMSLDAYRFIVLKQGYLYPELANISKRSILAFTKGGSTERLQDMGMKHIQRPVYPLDDGFEPLF